MTDLGLFRYADGRWQLEEPAPGFTAAEVMSLTDLPDAHRLG